MPGLRPATTCSRGCGCGGLGGCGFGGGGFGGSGTSDVDDTSREDLVDEILGLLQETINPDTWRDDGGDIGSISELEGSLIVTQTAEAHEQMLDLLQCPPQRTHAEGRVDRLQLRPAQGACGRPCDDARHLRRVRPAHDDGSTGS